MHILVADPARYLLAPSAEGNVRPAAAPGATAAPALAVPPDGECVPTPEPSGRALRHDRSHPFWADVRERSNLNGRGSDKKTVHLALSLAGSGIAYRPGDTLGVLPRNSPSTVQDLLAAAGLAGDASVSVDGRDRGLAQALQETFEVTTITRGFLRAYAAETRQPALTALMDAREPFRAYCHGRELVDVLEEYPPAGLSPQSFVAMLRRLQPRLYSIASSQLVHLDEAYLLVGLTRYESHGRVREGVCSGHLCERLADGERLPIYLSPNPRFRLPADPNRDIIMIGPGTGVAPFRAFVEERAALGCRGRNWLFFSDRHAATDFLYQRDWQRWHRAGVLTRLDLAFSRDQPEKHYVQHRMLAAAREVYAWLEGGAHVYVCGDATRMAAAVHEALLAIVARESGQGREAASEYLDRLRAGRRYQRDVY
jgi:sulfite reductase (NADPH) flavoprotein alpha-component